MARKNATHHEMRELFKSKGGKIILHTHNNIMPPFLVGLAERHTVGAAPKAATETPYSVDMYLALINLVDVDPSPGPDPVEYEKPHRLDRVPNPTESPDPGPVPATYGPHFADPGGEPDPGNYWFVNPFSESDVPDISLLDFIQNYVADDSPSPPPPPSHLSYITEVTAEETSPERASEQLLSLMFGDDHTFAHDDGQYWYEEDEDENIIGGWDGWGFMYFIGTPEEPFGDQPQPYGPDGLPDDSFPGLGLGEYTVSRLNGINPPLPAPQGVGNGAFTLCYVKTRFLFTALTTTENGETVHRVHCKHVGKQTKG
ncbi:MAG: hypothetical protein LBK57_11685 [Clostridiales Family XIII bacterium]|jgi:hypothetical protein|nr:hypothetical protein [Clostridiales Family XIII bacterium]